MSAERSTFAGRLPLAAALVLAALAAAERADACSCAGPFPPCQAAWQSPTVFIGRVLDITPIDRVTRIEGLTEPLRLTERRVRVRIAEVFRGAVGDEVEVFTASDGAACGYGFVIGQTYLIYGDDHTGRLSTSSCSRTRPLSEASEDLAYIRGSSRQPSALGTIQGLAERMEDSPDSSALPSVTPFEGAAVVAESNGLRYEARTGRDGTYRMRVPTGRYRIDARVPDGLYVESFPEGRFVEVLDARGCAAADFGVFPDGRISGRVVDPRGDPVAGIMVEALVFDWSNSLHDRGSAFTDEQGRYELTRLQPGRYVIGIGPERGNKPGWRILHPGAAEASTASRVELGSSERLTMADLALPASARTVPVTGTVRDTSGRPIAGVSIWLHHGDAFSLAAGPAVTDRDGNFQLTILAGRYRVVAEIRAGRRIRRQELPPFEAAAAPAPFDVTLPD